MPTLRGLGILLVAAGAYVGGRTVGTYELYLVAIALTVVVIASLLVVRLSGSRLHLERTLYPPEPVAGDSAQMRFHLHNRSISPTPPLRVAQPLPNLAGVQLLVDVSPLPPHGRHVSTEELPSLRRGVFVVDPAEVTFTDPLGAARRRRTLGGDLRVTVLPHIAVLRSCVFFGSGSLGAGRRSRPSPATSAVDLRGVRPHQPGEPLSHIDWKSTAKTGVLMLREMEEPSRTDLIVVLDGTRSAQVGDAPDNTFEAAVTVAGSVGDFVLREGFGVALLRHGSTDDDRRFEAGAHTRRDLQLALAEATPDALEPVSTCLRAHRTLLSHGLAVVMVTPILEPPALHEMIALAERGVPVFLVYIDAASFVPGAQPGALDPRGRAFLLHLQAGGVPSLTVRRGDDLRAILSANEPGVAVPSGASVPFGGVTHTALAGVRGSS
jgi:uncharacterized protein (DUF58 family)